MDATTFQRLLRTDLMRAAADRDTARVRLLRTTIGAIANAEAVDQPTAAMTEVPRRHLDAEAVGAILQREIDERAIASGEYESHGAESAARRLRAEIVVLEGYLAMLRGV